MFGRVVNFVKLDFVEFVGGLETKLRLLFWDEMDEQACVVELVSRVGASLAVKLENDDPAVDVGEISSTLIGDVGDDPLTLIVTGGYVQRQQKTTKESVMSDALYGEMITKRALLTKSLRALLEILIDSGGAVEGSVRFFCWSFM